MLSGSRQNSTLEIPPKPRWGDLLVFLLLLVSSLPYDFTSLCHCVIIPTVICPPKIAIMINYRVSQAEHLLPLCPLNLIHRSSRSQLQKTTLCCINLMFCAELFSSFFLCFLLFFSPLPPTTSALLQPSHLQMKPPPAHH